MRKVYTIGYDARELDYFIRILQYYKITVVVDVRRFPRSRFYKYNREFLEKELPQHGIDYYWLGESLGGFRGNYVEYMKTQDFINGFNMLCRIIDEYLQREGFSVIMCREKIPWRCHRRFISSLLYDSGYKVYHIIDKGDVREHKYSVKRYGLDPGKLLSNQRLY